MMYIAAIIVTATINISIIMRVTVVTINTIVTAISIITIISISIVITIVIITIDQRQSVAEPQDLGPDVDDFGALRPVEGLLG